MTTTEAVPFRVEQILVGRNPAREGAWVTALPCTPTGPVEVSVSTWEDGVPHVVLTYRRLWHGDWRPAELHTALVPTEPNYGGLRWWLVCPRCGGRCGVLYAVPKAYDDELACRQCHHLVYASQLETRRQRVDRAWIKALGRLRVQLDDNPAFPQRPRGMHRQTYARLIRRARTLGLARVLAGGKGLRWVEDLYGPATKEG